MHRFYAPGKDWNDTELILTEGEAHHALKVLRVTVGERVAVLDGEGNENLCDVRSADRKKLVLCLKQKNYSPPLPCQVTLIQAIPKGKIIEEIIQKATELGVHRIIPILSERTVPHLDKKDIGAKSGKWQQVAIEAIKQCGQPWLPRVEPPVSFQELIRRAEKFELPLIASLQSGSRHPREFFKMFFTGHQRPPKSISIWVGPEGDFTPAETAAAISAGALPITLGKLILRCETAAVYSLSCIHYELQSPI